MCSLYFCPHMPRTSIQIIFFVPSVCSAQCTEKGTKGKSMRINAKFIAKSYVGCSFESFILLYYLLFCDAFNLLVRWIGSIHYSIIRGVCKNIIFKSKPLTMFYTKGSEKKKKKDLETDKVLNNV